MKIIKILTILAILFCFGISFYFYPQIPNEMVSHWGVDGQPDDYMSKNIGLFIAPVISLVLFLLFLFLPKIDPLRKNIEGFRKYYDMFIFLFILFLLYMQVLVIIWNLGYEFDMGRFLSIAFAVLFFYIGVLLCNSKRNWFLGIRTPWSLSSDIVWDKTNKMGGRLFKLAGIISLLGFFIPKYAFVLVLAPVILFSILTVVYSYFTFKKIT